MQEAHLHILGLGADSEEKREPASDIDKLMVNLLKALGLNGRLESGLARAFMRSARQYDTAYQFYILL
jgi:hypothetical protein